MPSMLEECKLYTSSMPAAGAVWSFQVVVMNHNIFDVCDPSLKAGSQKWRIAIHHSTLNRNSILL